MVKIARAVCFLGLAPAQRAGLTQPIQESRTLILLLLRALLRDFIHGLLILRGAHREIMPIELVFHEGYATPFAGFGDDHERAGVAAAQGARELGRVVAVGLDRLDTKRAELFRERFALRDF